MYLSLTNGTITVVFSDHSYGIDDNKLMNWTPKSSINWDEPVSETAMFVVFSTLSGSKTVLRDLKRLFSYVGTNPLEPKVYLEYESENGQTRVRSEIVYGNAQMNESTFTNGDTWFKRYHIKLEWQRKGWETVSEFAIQMSNINGTNQTQLEVDNTHDTTRQNFVNLNAATILGDFPVPVRIEIKNNYVDSNRVSKVIVAKEMNGRGFLIESENEDFQLVGATTTPTSYASNGNYVNYPNIGSTDTLLARWTMNTTMLSANNGGFFRFLIRFSNSLPSGVFFKWVIRMELTEIDATDWMEAQTSARLQEFGSLQLPPNTIRPNNPYPLTIELHAKKLTAGTTSIAIDFLSAVSTEGFRRLISMGYGSANGITINDDMIGDNLYTIGWSTDGEVGNFVSEGNKIFVYPNRSNQRIFFFTVDDVNGHDINRTSQIKLYHRPRYSGL